MDFLKIMKKYGIGNSSSQYGAYGQPVQPTTVTQPVPVDINAALASGGLKLDRVLNKTSANPVPTAAPTYSDAPVTPTDTASYDTYNYRNYQDPEVLSEAINTAIKPKVLSPTQQFYQTRAQQMDDRLFNRGAYYIDPNAGYSPSQVEQKINSADDLYKEKLNTLQKAANNDYSSLNLNTETEATPYLRALLTSPKIGASGTDTKRILSQLSTASPEQQISVVKQLAYNNLEASQKSDYDNNQSAASTAQYAISSIDPSLVNNPYKHTLNEYVTYFGGKKDPKYTNFIQLVQSVVAPIRKSFFGTSLSTKEAQSANSFLPNPDTDDEKTLVLKLRNVDGIARYKNDAAIANTLGLPKPNLDDYIEINPDGTPKVRSNTDQAAQGLGGVNPSAPTISPTGGFDF